MTTSSQIFPFSVYLVRVWGFQLFNIEEEKVKDCLGYVQETVNTSRVGSHADSLVEAKVVLVCVFFKEICGEVISKRQGKDYGISEKKSSMKLLSEWENKISYRNVAGI